MRLRGTLGDKLFEAEDPTILRKSYHKGGSRTYFKCKNEDTRTRAKQTAPKLGVGGGRKVVAGDYKDLMRTSSVLLRPTDPLVDRDVKQSFKRIEIQNSGISTGA